MVPTVRLATLEDLQGILAWLKDEYDAEGSSFYSNANIIADSQAVGEMYALVLGIDDEPIGFHVGKPGHPDILAVRPDLRREGHGGILTDHFLDLARAAGVAVIVIECSPPTSIPYWVSKGFTLFPGGGSSYGDGSYAYLFVDHASSAQEGPVAQVDIEVYPASRDWDTTVAPMYSIRQKGVLLPDGYIWLPKWVPIFNIRTRAYECPVVRVIVDGAEVCCCKASRTEAMNVGVTEDALGNCCIPGLMVSQ